MNARAANWSSAVALRKESVDRNDYYTSCTNLTERSLSARRAWIEIDQQSATSYCCMVALRKESVDRN